MSTEQIAEPPARAVDSTEQTIRVWDGTELFYRAWLAEEPTDKAVLLFHRGHEHSGRFHDLVERMAIPRAHVFAWDARGHGRSPGERGFADSYRVMVKDVDSFVTGISEQHGVPVENMVVLAHSVGAVTVAAWVHDHAPPIRAMVLATPALRVKLYIPFAIPFLRIWLKLKGKAFVKSYVKGRMLTHDAKMSAEYEDDPLISRQIAVNMLLGLHDTATRLIDDAHAISVPTLLLGASRDWVVRLPAQRRFFDGLSSRKKEMKVYDGMYHAILHERDRQRPISDAKRFIEDALEGDPVRPSPADTADGNAVGMRRYERLLAPAPWWQRPYWAAARVFLRTVGRLSTGISVGWSDGFDSGRSLDHVYRDTAQGVTPLGRLIDRFYLGAPGWKGIRQRRVHMEHMLDRAIDAARESTGSVQIMDIASGPGRYLLEAIRRRSGEPIAALLRDRDEAGLVAGRRLAESMGVADRAEFERGDAFDREELAAITPRPTIAVVSGLYELFPDNAPIRDSLRGLHAAVADGGFLIYTNQPWHPQLDFIARVLINRDGEPWVMRCRSQAEMDELVREAGFAKLDMEADEDGIFTVSLARRA